MKRNAKGDLVVENEKDVQDIINDRVDMNPDLDGEDGREEEPDNYDNIRGLRAQIEDEKNYLSTISLEDVEMRQSCLDNIVRMSDLIETLSS